MTARHNGWSYTALIVHMAVSFICYALIVEMAISFICNLTGVIILKSHENKTW